MVPALPRRHLAKDRQSCVLPIGSVMSSLTQRALYGRIGWKSCPAIIPSSATISGAAGCPTGPRHPCRSKTGSTISQPSWMSTVWSGSRFSGCRKVLPWPSPTPRATRNASLTSSFSAPTRGGDCTGNWPRNIVRWRQHCRTGCGRHGSIEGVLRPCREFVAAGPGAFQAIGRPSHPLCRR